MDSSIPEFKVKLRPADNSTYFLFIATDGSRQFGSDFDVRAHTSVVANNEFIFTFITGSLFSIRSATNPQYYLFGGDDGSNKYGQDWDVRTRISDQNNLPSSCVWIVEKVNRGYTLRNSASVQMYLFVANDGTNGYETDFDIRCHATKETRNDWILDNFSYVPQTQKVTIRTSTRPDNYLFVANDGSNALGSEFDVRTHTTKEARNELLVTRVSKAIYLISPPTNPDYYIFIADDGTRKYGGDFDVRARTNKDLNGNLWKIYPQGGGFCIASVYNPTFLMFTADDGTNKYGQDFDVRTHTTYENRNVWLMDNFVLHDY